MEAYRKRQKPLRLLPPPSTQPSLEGTSAGVCFPKHSHCINKHLHFLSKNKIIVCSFFFATVFPLELWSIELFSDCLKYFFFLKHLSCSAYLTFTQAGSFSPCSLQAIRRPQQFLQLSNQQDNCQSVRSTGEAFLPPQMAWSSSWITSPSGKRRL